METFHGADTVQRLDELNDVVVDGLRRVQHQICTNGFPPIARTEDVFPTELVPVWNVTPSALDARSMQCDVVALGEHEKETDLLFFSQGAALRDLWRTRDTIEDDGACGAELGARERLNDGPSDGAVTRGVHTIECGLELGVRPQAAHGPVVAQHRSPEMGRCRCCHGRLSRGLQSGNENEDALMLSRC